MLAKYHSILPKMKLSYLGGKVWILCFVMHLEVCIDEHLKSTFHINQMRQKLNKAIVMVCKIKQYHIIIVY